MNISREDVLRVAELAHLELSPAEIDMYRAQLDQILGYIDKLKELDVAAVEPMSQVLFSDSTKDHPELREDVVRPCEYASEILAQSKDSAEPFFRVPKVIER